ncbi:D-aminoacyl-tRNA deacylase [Fibrella sp. HMF5335]|uniref:D-aminoacyl-tRNA deacylase n=1 Tax=Fibrella rubiginis TaxID=2817060 RepID=A0A939GLE3_9BACT|nr:D-aminoacyl-tRNA deacylase [Fibrella rubiginis]
MIAVIQRVREATVRIDGQVKRQIQTGFLVLLGVRIDIGV